MKINEGHKLFFRKANKNRTLLVIDVQPEIDNFAPNYDHCALARAMSEYNKVIYIVDEIMASGHIDEPDVHPKVREYLNEDQLPSLLEEYGYDSLEQAEEDEDYDLLDQVNYCPLSPHIDLRVKAYGGFLRIAMDIGLEYDAIEFFIDALKGKSTDVLFEKHEGFLSEFNMEMRRDDLVELAEELQSASSQFISGIPNDVWSMGPFDIAGGHRNYCVREITMALDILGIDYDLIEPLIYDKDQSSLSSTPPRK